MKKTSLDFIRESNYIENIHREPTKEEIDEFNRFMNLSQITVEELEKFVSVYQSEAKLRDQYGLNVKVGRYLPPFGGPEIRESLKNILKNSDAFKTHIEYEKLHPFTDCNGRSGRMLWAWQIRDFSRGFLHLFYYQTLQQLN